MFTTFNKSPPPLPTPTYFLSFDLLYLCLGVQSKPYKYSTVPPKISVPFFPPRFSPSIEKLISASTAQASWRKHSSAVSCFRKYESDKGLKVAWPISRETVCDFVTWCVFVRKLKASTVKSYISSFEFIFKLNDWDTTVCNHFLVKQLIKGASNLNFYSDLTKNSRKVMTLPLLKILGHQIAKSNFSKWDRQVIWAACTVAFFGSF
jgi:hypothetical protein